MEQFEAVDGVLTLLLFQKRPSKWVFVPMANDLSLP